MSRATRLTGRQYRRFTPEQRQAADALLFGAPSVAARARAKTILGWRRTREETEALVADLLEAKVTPKAIADDLHVSDAYLSKVLASLKTSRNRSGGAADSALTDIPKPVGRAEVTSPSARTYRVYSGDPFEYDFAATLAEVVA